ncbi:hypothetical protein COCC4DRAFT_31211 [Bipolaris maydis ATCC 48331]|uniref:Uncharacterized protein n=2 Tax=Cochliobolus heterostrophus TaxID=5016 RepID=M2V036_COCH5|nr:uncharacterized protein COCC4DRAFT_31211 [Bipolaris maydis ATCC 48331]EMD93383.1 hypothetical protein COCHEDRAFT_1020492 [Bipolaris maydis C5]KAH7562326.1 hypothetical protein BM1_01846 [Bipolaris maydis]ENI07169.1 hypothetical protein COCC4DRAFT_31211 [Bipolaris maydis ATCC 48331]KAJ5027706.1 hypothetical protein J3E73DRAFT_295081 [Bipolaris maydis]KAJ5062462.1 hypothetical protein J3E74DRAFT_322154 [Bipolaris maydis]
MASTSPTISLYLNGSLSFQLGHKGTSGTIPTLQVQMHDASHAATLVIPGYQSSTNTFNPVLALQGGLFDLFDVGTDSQISIPSSDQEPGRLVVEAGARNRWFDLRIDTRGDFWTQLLTPGHNYEIRWRNDGNFPWAYRGNSHEESHERLPVRLLPRPIKFNVFDDAASPLQLSISLQPTADTCRLSGEPRFGFKLQVVSHDEKTITVCLHKTPLRELHGLGEIAHVVDEDGEEVEWPYGIGCFEGREPFPSDDMFEELKPNVPYEKTFWLEKLDRETSNGGELEELESGQLYTGKVSKTLLGAFSKWKRGTKEELLAGEEKDKEARWRGSSEQMLLDVSGPFKFKAI